jgi:hypothetical protein
MDTNHRGGPPGFVRMITSADGDGLTIVYPEYSGNRLYQTLGNLQTTPKAGLVFPDFDTGDVLYVTGSAEILTGPRAKDLIEHSNLAVKIQVEAARYARDSLTFRRAPEVEVDYSPYNPQVRYLSTESRLGVAKGTNQLSAKLIRKEILTPTIGRFRFRIMNDEKKSSKWKNGQYVALSFQDELDHGYSHMRDDDPKSLNDDFVRTFTVSSPRDKPEDEFEITIRKVGPVTEYLFRHNVRSDLDVQLQGFGGEFFINQNKEETVSFVAGGVGITPFLAQAKDLDLTRLRLYWSVKSEDLKLVLATFGSIPNLASSTTLFITGTGLHLPGGMELQNSGAVILSRRIEKCDLSEDTSSRWYLCTGTALRSSLLEWLRGKSVFYEDFNY